jgi:hypothetical protein
VPSTCPNRWSMAVTRGVWRGRVSGVETTSERAIGLTSKLATRVRFSSPAPTTEAQVTRGANPRLGPLTIRNRSGRVPLARRVSGAVAGRPYLAGSTLGDGGQGRSRTADVSLSAGTFLTNAGCLEPGIPKVSVVDDDVGMLVRPHSLQVDLLAGNVAIPVSVLRRRQRVHPSLVTT